MALNRWLGAGDFSPLFGWPYEESHWSHAMRHMDRQMRDLQRNMDHVSNHAQRHFGMTPMDFRLAEADNMLHPVVTDKDGNRKLQYSLDVRQFKPEEIDIKTKDGTIKIHAKHEENTEHGRIYREYQRSCALPKDLDPQTLKSQLGQDGVLRIEAPLPKALEEAPKEHQIAIKHE